MSFEGNFPLFLFYLIFAWAMVALPLIALTWLIGAACYCISSCLQRPAPGADFTLLADDDA